MRRHALFCALAVLLVACGDAVAGSGPGDLAGRTFLSQSVTEDGAARELVGGTQISVRFHDDGRLTASAGCNTLLGELTVTDDTLEIAGMGMTEMGCDPPRMEQDQWLAGFLDSSPAWTLDGDELTLSSGGTEIVLLDREVADPDRPLEGTRWVVDTLLRGTGPDGAASSMAGGTEGSAWLEIGTDGTFTASSGCREFQGTAVVNNGSVTFSDTVQTDQACAPEFEDLDSTMTIVLGGEVEYEITAARLVLSHPDGVGLGLHADE
ncbi:MAG TPA: META domain-containing protein [Jiangellaceae bacterium]